MSKKPNSADSLPVIPPIGRESGNDREMPQGIFPRARPFPRQGTSGNHREPAGMTAPHRWLRSVLREDVVPLQVVTARARMEGLDMQELWRAIRVSCIQQHGMNGTRYLKLPRTIWALPKLTPHCEEAADSVARSVATKAALARLRLPGDERIVCGACCFSNGTECPSGQPIPDNVPNRCQHFQEKDWK